MDDLCKDTTPFSLPFCQWVEPHGIKGPQWNAAHCLKVPLQSERSFCPWCQVGDTDTHRSRHSRNKPHNVFSAVISVSPPILVTVFADSVPIEGDRHLQSGRRTSLCTDRLLAVLWVSIFDPEPFSLDPVRSKWGCQREWPSVRIEMEDAGPVFVLFLYWSSKAASLKACKRRERKWCPSARASKDHND